MFRTAKIAAVVAVIALSVSACGATKGSTPDASTPARATAPVVTKGYWSDGDWSAASKPTLKDDGLGDFGGSLVLTYNGDDASGGDLCVDVDVLKGDDSVASLEGCVNDVKPGHKGIVDLISSDNYKSGSYTIEIHKSF